MFKTTKGLILREVKYKEADRILTVLTEDMGKITVKARGALRKGSKVAAATQLFAFSELTMFENKGRWSVNEGSTIEEFKGLRNDISALALAAYFAECAEALADEGSPDPGMLQLILNCLFALSNGLYDQQHIKTAFELRLMRIAGYEPDLSACIVCGDSEPKNHGSARKTASSAAATAAKASTRRALYSAPIRSRRCGISSTPNRESSWRIPYRRTLPKRQPMLRRHICSPRPNGDLTHLTTGNR